MPGVPKGNFNNLLDSLKLDWQEEVINCLPFPKQAERERHMVHPSVGFSEPLFSHEAAERKEVAETEAQGPCRCYGRVSQGAETPSGAERSHVNQGWADLA